MHRHGIYAGAFPKSCGASVVGSMILIERDKIWGVGVIRCKLCGQWDIDPNTTSPEGIKFIPEEVRCTCKK